MKLSDLAGIDSDSEVTGFAIDHRKVAKGSVFGAFRGAMFNGEDFIGEAVDRGAVAVVARPEASSMALPESPGMPGVTVYTGWVQPLGSVPRLTPFFGDSRAMPWRSDELP